MPVAVKNAFIKERLKKGLKPPISQALKIIADDNKAEAKSHGWKRFAKGIEYKKDSDTKGRVYVNDEVTASVGAGGTNRISTATNKQIGGFLEFGTPDHGPVTAKAMRWFKGSKVIFAKRVKGIKATPWWGLKQKSKDAIRELLKKFFGAK